jgi:ERCC4-type nuclease
MDAGKSDRAILIDTREQRPFLFDGAVRRTLRTGDYSIEGAEDLIAIERKSLSDLLGCIGQGRNRFERELERLGAMPYPAVVIEASLAEVLNGTRHTSIHPNSVLGSLCAWSIRYRLPLFFCGNRALAQLVTERLLMKAAKYAAGRS